MCKSLCFPNHTHCCTLYCTQSVRLANDDCIRSVSLIYLNAIWLCIERFITCNSFIYYAVIYHYYSLLINLKFMFICALIVLNFEHLGVSQNYLD